MEITRAEIHDAPAIAQLIASSLAPASADLTIYGCSGVAQYVADNIRARTLGIDTLYTVARHGNDLAGCVELRLLPGELCLNYIAVSDQARGRGLGRALFRSALEAPECHGYEKLVLDVAQSNTLAFDWYRRLGFACSHQVNWYVLPALTPPNSPPACTLSGFPQAEAAHGRFGFSTFHLITRKGDYPVGRLGTAWFRVTRAAALLDEDFLPALARADARRRVLLLAPEGQGPPLPPGAELRRTSSRMEIDLRELLARLSPDH